MHKLSKYYIPCHRILSDYGQKRPVDQATLCDRRFFPEALALFFRSEVGKAEVEVISESRMLFNLNVPWDTRSDANI